MVLTAKIGMFALLLAALPDAVADPTVWAQWGLAGLVVSYTLWRDYNRELRMGMSLDENQKWTRETLVDALERNSAALESLNDRPCAAKEQ